MNKKQLLPLLMVTTLSSPLLAGTETTYLTGIAHAFSNDGKAIVAQQPFTWWETCKAQIAPGCIPAVGVIAMINAGVKEGVRSKQMTDATLFTGLLGSLSWFGGRWALNKTDSAPVSWNVAKAVKQLRKLFNRSNTGSFNNLVSHHLKSDQQTFLEEATATNLTDTDGSKGYKLVDLKRFFDRLDSPSDTIVTGLGKLVDRNEQDNALYRLYQAFEKDRNILGKVENVIQSSAAYKDQWASFSGEHAHDRAQEQHRSQLASDEAERQRLQAAKQKELAEAAVKAREAITGKKATVVTDNTHRIGAPRL